MLKLDDINSVFTFTAKESIMGGLPGLGSGSTDGLWATQIHFPWQAALCCQLQNCGT